MSVLIRDITTGLVIWTGTDRVEARREVGLRVLVTLDPDERSRYSIESKPGTVR